MAKSLYKNQKIPYLKLENPLIKNQVKILYQKKIEIFLLLLIIKQLKSIYNKNLEIQCIFTEYKQKSLYKKT